MAECRVCGCKHMLVTNTYPNRKVRWAGKVLIVTKRRRVCRHCGTPIITTEINEEDLEGEEYNGRKPREKVSEDPLKSEQDFPKLPENPFL